MDLALELDRAKDRAMQLERAVKEHIGLEQRLKEHLDVDSVPDPPRPWVRMRRVLVYEGPEEWVMGFQNLRVVKESQYFPTARILEEVCEVTQMTEGEQKQAKVAVNLTNRQQVSMGNQLAKTKNQASTQAPSIMGVGKGGSGI